MSDYSLNRHAPDQTGRRPQFIHCDSDLAPGLASVPAYNHARVITKHLAHSDATAKTGAIRPCLPNRLYQFT